MASLQHRQFDRRAQRVRTKLRKVADGKPRLSVTRSTKHISVQLIDDAKGVTVAAASSLEKDFKGGTKSEDAASVGKLIAERAQAGRRHRRGVRPRRLHLSWPRESARRCRP